MKKLICLFLIINSFTLVNGQQLELEGRVTDKETNSPLQGATVRIQTSKTTVTTNKDGYFTIRNLSAQHFLVSISYVGYETSEIAVNINEMNKRFIDVQLSSIFKTGDSVVVSASRRPEKITDAPASIQVIGQKEISQFSGSNVGELAAYIQGLEFVRMGVDNVSFNARGLNNAFNNKVFQMIDGRNSMSPLSGSLMMSNNMSANKEDIERVEILLGPQTALYGPNVHNALLNYITKDPRKFGGTTLAVSAGNQRQFSSRIRQAGKINDKWAYKITGEYVTGTEFEFRDSIRGVGGGVYGPLDTIAERIDFDFRRIRGEVHVYYNLTPKATLIASAGGSRNNTIGTTTGGHNQFVDMTNHFLQARYTSPRFYATVYNAWADFGTSYNVSVYTREFWNRTHSTIRDPNDPRFATQGFLSADEADAFAKQRGRFKETPQRLNAEAQYNYHFAKQQLYVVAGLSYQNEKPRGYGINLVDSFERIYITQYGAVLQLEKSLPWNLSFIGAGRVDKHSNFGRYFSPKVGLVKSIGAGKLRFTWGRATSMPSILYQYASTGGSFFGNGEGITYIPSGIKISDTASFKTTRRLAPEQVSTWEIGFKGKLTKKLYLDITYYNGTSTNFFTPSIQVAGRALMVGNRRVTHHQTSSGTVDRDGTISAARFSTIFNFGDINVYGLDVGTNYQFTKNVSLALKYSWIGSNIKDGQPGNDANADGWVTADERSLNSPRNRLIIISNIEQLLSNQVFFNVAARYVERYDFYSGFQISSKAGERKWGEILTPNNIRYTKNFNWGPLGGFTTVDVRAGYRVSPIVSLTAGVTNLFNKKQREYAGSGLIKRLVSFEMRIHIP